MRGSPGQPHDLVTWVQELGRAGRHGLPSIASLFFMSDARRYSMSQAMKAFVAMDLHHFNPQYAPQPIWATLSGSTPEEKAQHCCSVCQSRGYLSDVGVPDRFSDDEEAHSSERDDSDEDNN